MSIESLAVVLHHSKARGAEKLVLIGIANHDGDGGSWPSMVTLAKYAGVSRDQARKLVASLERRGEVKRLVNGGGLHSAPSYTRPNRYLMLLKCPADCDRSTQHRTKGDMAVPVFLDIESPEPFGDMLALVSDPPAALLAPSPGDSDVEGGPPAAPRDEPSSNPTTHLSEENSSNRAREAEAPLDPCPGGRGTRPCTYVHGKCIDCQRTDPNRLEGTA